MEKLGNMGELPVHNFAVAITKFFLLTQAKDIPLSKKDVLSFIGFLEGISNEHRKTGKTARGTVACSPFQL